MSQNIADKQRFLAELARIVRPGGHVALFEVVAGPGGRWNSRCRGPTVRLTGPRRSVAHTPRNRSPGCRPSTPSGNAHPKLNCYRCYESSGIGFVPYSPLGYGSNTGTIRSPDELADDDWRKTNPRFTEGNFEKNLRIVDEVQAVASEVDATPAQVALAWLLAQGDDIAPIPGTKRVTRVEENTAADAIELERGADPTAQRSHPSHRRAPRRGEHVRRQPLTNHGR